MRNLRSLLRARWATATDCGSPGPPSRAIGFLGSDIPIRRARLDRRLATGLFRPARKNVVTAAEVAGFLKPPTIACPV